LLLLGLCAGAFSCSSSEVDSLEVESQEAAPELAIATESFPPTLEETYPFVRFTDFGDGQYKALVPVALGGGTIVKDVLVANCPSLARTEAPATIDVKQGYAVQGDPKVDPWLTQASMIPVEDLLLLSGAQSDVAELLDFIDFYFNSSPQIEIQAQIIEVADTKAFERGVKDLNLFNLRDSAAFADGSPGPFARSMSGTGLEAEGFAGQFSLGLIRDNYSLSAFLQLVDSSNAADIVSRPRAITRNGRTAYLSSQESIPYQKLTAYANGNPTFGVDYRKVGVTLQVLPVIVGADTIHLSFQGNVSKEGRSVTISDGGAGGGGGAIAIPVVATRDVKTEVSVRSGQSVVIGGLNTLETRIVERKIPLLGDIPGLGWLFSSKSEQTVKTEVLFILTPVIKTRAASISRFGDIFDPWEEE
jgi:type II secretory pathway component GspD/PulD (secretin)